MRSVMAGLLLAGWSALAVAHPVSRLADVAIIDRDSGARLEMYYWHGAYWVAGEPGARYAIYIRNMLPERLLAVASVDGINAVTGESAGWNQAGYVFDAEADYQITGWRKSDSMVAAFAFTSPSSSYAQRTGRPENIGVIGLALFRERPAVPPRVAFDAPQTKAPVPAESAASAAPAPRASEANGDLARRQMPMAAAPGLGTAHGEREYSYVDHTNFARLHPQPDEIVRIRYDTRENLMAMGIVRRPHILPTPAPDPFPAAQSYVPDPPAG